MRFIGGRKRGFELGNVVRRAPRGQARDLPLPSRDPASTYRNTAGAAACCGTDPPIVPLAPRKLYSTRRLRPLRCVCRHIGQESECLSK